MAGDWIKMRVWLRRDPKVIWMADFLAVQRDFMNWLTDPVRARCKTSAYEHVTSNVTRALCVTSLLEIWGTAREHGHRDGDDLVVTNCNLVTLDEIADVPSIGLAMEEVGWAKMLQDGGDSDVTIFPNFFKIKQLPAEKQRSQAAERQARYRNKRNSNVTGDGVTSDGVTQESNVTSDVTRCATGDVTVAQQLRNNASSLLSPNSSLETTNQSQKTEELPEEEKVTRAKGGLGGKKSSLPTIEQVREYCEERAALGFQRVDPEHWFDHYSSNGWRVGKNGMKDWKAAVRTWEKNGFANGNTRGPGRETPEQIGARMRAENANDPHFQAAMEILRKEKGQCQSKVSANGQPVTPQCLDSTARPT
jgi:hypothetical protein